MSNLKEMSTLAFGNTVYEVVDKQARESAKNSISNDKIAQPKGVASLDEAGKIPLEQIPDGIQADVDSDTINKLSAEIAVERARINQFVALDEGSTTGDAELVDGRVDFRGKTWDNIGDSLRGVSRELYDLIRNNVECYNFEYNVTELNSVSNIFKLTDLYEKEVDIYITEYDVESGKDIALSIELSDGTTKYLAVTNGVTNYSYPNLFIKSIEIYVSANYLTRMAKIKGFVSFGVHKYFNDLFNSEFAEMNKKYDYLNGYWFDSTCVTPSKYYCFYELSDVLIDTLEIDITTYDFEEGKEAALAIDLSDGNTEYTGINSTGKRTYHYDGKKIVHALIYVSDNYLTRESRLAGCITSAESGMVVKNKAEIEKLKGVIANIPTNLTFDNIASLYRYIVFGFTNGDMQLCISGSNDGCKTIESVLNNVYKPNLGRGTLRDPSFMVYKGNLYIVYTIIDWVIGSSNIGFCRTRDLCNFCELPQLPTDNEVLHNIPRVYAPAFCVIDDHVYVVSQALPPSDDGSYNGDIDYNKEYKTMVHEYFPESHTLTFVGLLDGISDIDTHIYKIGDYYYAACKNFMLYKSDSLLGKYSLVWDGCERNGDEVVYREGAYMLKLPSGKWRFFAQKPSTTYEYYDSISDNIDDGFEDTMHMCSIDSDSAQHYTIMDVVSDYNVVK